MPKLSARTGFPKGIGDKIYKTGQTRGAENDEIYQNRVSRDSTVLIPLPIWNAVRDKLPRNGFHRGYIVFAHPEEYFDSNMNRRSDIDPELVLGVNLLIFYRTRNDWTEFNPLKLNWTFATSRTPPLGGEYIARVPDTTSDNDEQIFHGYTSSDTGGKGAGIRFFEYASPRTLERTRYQLAYLIWHSICIEELCESYNCPNIEESKNYVINYCQKNGLADNGRLEAVRVIWEGMLICPFCLEEINASDFIMKLDQAEGRETLDLTVTRINLFHIEELRPGFYNHREYNLGWGHHHCNTVVADMGIQGALDWLEQLMISNGYNITK